MEICFLKLLITCGLAWITECRRPFVFRFKSTQCLANSHFISTLECSVQNRNTAPTITIDLILAQDVGALTFDFLILLPNVRRDIELFNMTLIDGCAFLANTVQFPVVKIIRKEFEKYSNFPKKCPVTKGAVLKVRELRLDPESFPNYVPETKFYVRVRMYEANVYLFNLTINGTCEYTRRFAKGWG